MTRNQLQYMANEEIARSNRAKELENLRHNIATEKEANRSNFASEIETKRSNLMREIYQNRSLDETQRHNRVSEATEGVKSFGTILRGIGSII